MAALDENAQLEVEISNLILTEAEYELVAQMLDRKLMGNVSPITCERDSYNNESDYYEIRFRIYRPAEKDYSQKLGDWLRDIGHVGFRVSGTFVPPERW